MIGLIDNPLARMVAAHGFAAIAASPALLLKIGGGQGLS
jgi:hypothetical protein